MESQALGELGPLPSWCKTLGPGEHIQSRNAQAGLILPWDVIIWMTFPGFPCTIPKHPAV